MFINRLINQGNAPLIEQMMRFTSTRHGLIMENIANMNTPGYHQQDLSMSAFQEKLRDRVRQRKSAGPGATRFDDLEADLLQPRSGVLFHDRGNRSPEQLMSNLSGNALRHNMYVELLRKQYEGLHDVLKERVA
jgi:flagellar basal-body rod protein FlgB